MNQPDEFARLEEIMAVILSIAANEFNKRAFVGAEDTVLDGIATAINMLAEEVERQRAKELEYRAKLLQSARLAAVGTLAVGVAHEVNNPSAYLMTNFSVMEERIAELRDALKSPNGAARPAIDMICQELSDIVQDGKDGVRRITTIVRGLQNFTKVETNAVTLVNLNEVAEQACSLILREIVQRATLIKNLNEVPAIVGEPTKLTQIITSLLLNAATAVERSSHDFREVEITTNHVENHIVLRVRDTGDGIPEAIQKRIFDPFFTTQKTGQGHGLGLSISADIAHQHNGEVRLAHTSAAGSVFELVLPVNTGLKLTQKTDTSSSKNKLRVLVIDDEVPLLKAYQRLLGRTHDVHTTSGGAEAISLFKNDQQWDLVICDMLMPGVDGSAVWDWVDANTPSLRERFYFSTGGAFTERAQALEERFEGRILRKPFSREDLEKLFTIVRALPARLIGQLRLVKADYHTL